MNNNRNILLDPTVADSGGTAATTTTAAPAATNGAPITFELNEISEGPLKNFKFYSPVYSDFDTMVTRLGKEAIMGVMASVGAARIRTKVKNDNVPEKFDTKNVAAGIQLQQTLLAKFKDGILYTQDEAASWRPDVRELSPNQMFKQARELMESKDPAKIQEGVALLLKMQKVMTEMAQGEAAAAAAQATTATT